jgi:pilus assembly protein CpaF
MVMAGSSLPYEAIVTQLSMGIDLIVHITRNKEGKRFIDEISTVLPSKNNEFRLERLYVTDNDFKLQRVCDDKTLAEAAG